MNLNFTDDKYEFEYVYLESIFLIFY